MIFQYNFKSKSLFTEKQIFSFIGSFSQQRFQIVSNHVMARQWYTEMIVARKTQLKQVVYSDCSWIGAKAKEGTFPKMYLNHLPMTVLVVTEQPENVRTAPAAMQMQRSILRSYVYTSRFAYDPLPLRHLCPWYLTVEQRIRPGKLERVGNNHRSFKLCFMLLC